MRHERRRIPLAVSNAFGVMETRRGPLVVGFLPAISYLAFCAGVLQACFAIEDAGGVRVGIWLAAVLVTGGCFLPELIMTRRGPRFPTARFHALAWSGATVLLSVCVFIRLSAGH